MNVIKSNLKFYSEGLYAYGPQTVDCLFIVRQRIRLNDARIAIVVYKNVYC
jgi:hypothetical protein